MHHSTRRRVVLGMATGGLLFTGVGIGLAHADTAADGAAAHSLGLAVVAPGRPTPPPCGCRPPSTPPTTPPPCGCRPPSTTPTAPTSSWSPSPPTMPTTPGTPGKVPPTGNTPTTSLGAQRGSAGKHRGSLAETGFDAGSFAAPLSAGLLGGGLLLRKRVRSSRRLTRRQH